ncbi:MAG TPA: LptF/LptG family permease [Caulobacteraceae bacterium]|nr:LptF/LptG family permease [Caulobacteraceae bacterium]
MTSPALSAPAAYRLRWRPAIIDGYLLRMLAAPAAAVLGVTLVAFLLEQTLRLIDQLAANGARMGYLFGLITNMVPYQLGLALPAAFFVAIFIVLGRLDEESQIDALLAGGISFERIVAPLVAAGVVLGIVSLLLAGYLQPYSRFGYRAVLNAATEAGWTARLDPEVFIKAGPSLTISADQADATGRELRGVFIRRKVIGGEQVVTADRGALGLLPDAKTTILSLQGGLVLTDGPKGARLLRFRDLTDREIVQGGAALNPRGGDEQELTLPELMSEAQRPDSLIPRRVLLAELAARITRSAVIPLLPFIALPLAIAAKRGRRTPGMIMGAVILVVFHHSVTLAKSFAAEGAVDPIIALGGLYATMFAFAMWLFFSSRRRPGETPISSFLHQAEQFMERRPKAPAAIKARGAMSLSAYLTKMMAVRTAGAAAALICLLQLIDLLERTSQILQRGGLLDIGRYMLLRLPFLFQEVAPFAVLAGAIFTFSQLARNSELVVMRISGLSLFQIFRRTAPVAVAVALLDMAVTDQVTPRAEQALATWWNATAPGAAHKPDQPRWFRIDGDVVLADGATPNGQSLRGVTIYERDAQKALTARVQAPQADWRRGHWALKDATITDLTADRASSMTVGQTDWRTTLRPSDAARIFAASYEMTSGEAIRSLFGRGPIDKAPSEFRTRVYRTIAEGMAPIIMLLLALPTALGHARSNRTAPIIFGLGCGLLYLVTDGILTAMGSTGVLPAGIAAWGAPIAFAAGAVSILLYTEG